MAKRGPKPETHDNSQVMKYLSDKSYTRLPKKVKSVLYEYTDKDVIGNGKGILTTYVFEALKNDSELTNINVGICINRYRTEKYLEKVVQHMNNDEYKYVRKYMFHENDGSVNIEFLKHHSSDFEELSLLEKKSIERYGKAARNASMKIETMINVPVPDESVKQLLDDLIKNGTDKKLIMDYLKRLK